MRHLLNCVFVVLAFATCANAQWQRQVKTSHGDFTDTATPHPLEYFTNDPFLRDEGNEFCIACTSADKATIHLKKKSSSKVQLVGTLEGFKIYDVFYYFDDDPRIAWKSLLVEAIPEQFIEIYHLQPTEARIGASFIIQAGDTTLLATKDPIPGTGAFNVEAYWEFDKTAGPILVDMKPIGDAAASLVPSGMGIWKGYGLEVASLNYSVAVWKEGDANCCPTGGSVEVQFKIVHGAIEFTSKRYTPAK